MPSYSLTVGHGKVTFYQHLNEIESNERTTAGGQAMGTTWGADLPGYTGFSVLVKPLEWPEIYTPETRLSDGEIRPLPNATSARMAFAPCFWWEGQMFESIAPFQSAWTGAATHIAGVLD